MMSRISFVFVLAALLLGSSVSLAQQSSPPEPVQEDEAPSDTPDKAGNFFGRTLEVVVDQMDGAHDFISGELETSARSMDEFFAEDTVFEESTETYLRIGLDAVNREYEGLGYAGEVRLKYDLPHTRKRLKLLIESDAQRGETENLEEKPTDVAQGRDYSVAIERVVPGALEVWNVRPSLGIKLHAPLDTFFRLRSHRYFSYDDKWLLRLGSKADWFDSRGFGANATIDLDRRLTQHLLFRYGPSLSWQEEEMFRRINQGFSIFQQIDTRQKMAYQILAQADDGDPVSGDWRGTRYDILVRYRRSVHKNWVFAEVIPQWTYMKENDFHGVAAITFRLEMVFGARFR